MKVCTLIGSDKGGVGKSLLAQLVVTAYDSAFEESLKIKVSDPQLRTRLKVVEIDFQHKLKAILGDRVDLSLDASALVSSMSRDRNAGMNHFDSAYDVWTEGSSMTDLGANVTTPLFAWARQKEIASFAKEDGIRFQFIAVTIPDDQALSSAFGSLKEARESLGQDTELYLVLNDNMGASGFAHFEATDRWKRIEDLAEASKVKIIKLPYCASEVMEWARANSYTIKEMLVEGPEIAARIAAQGDGSKFTARTQLRLFIDWVKEVQKELAPLFAKPEARRAAS